MPDSFFVTSKPRKRKRSVTQESGPSTSKKFAKGVNGKSATKGKGRASGGTPNSRKRRDEELSDETDEGEGEGIDEMDLRAPDVLPDAYESGEEDEDETPAEKRLRLAKLYLESVKQGLATAEGEFDAAEIDRDLISARLQKDVLEHAGKVHLFVAESYDFTHAPKLRLRGHRLSTTAAVGSTDARWLFTGSKDGSIVKWDMYTGRKAYTFYKVRAVKEKEKGKAVAEIQGHTDEVWALAMSEDGRYLASGGKDRRVGVWDVEKNEWVKGFGGHRDSISALGFRKTSRTSASSSTQLYSGSFDRTLKMFDLSSMGYVETLFGHQAPVLSLDALRGETAVSVGGRDKTVRFWKIPEETQLVFRGGGGSKWVDDLDGMDIDEDEDGAAVVGGKKANQAHGKTQEKFVEGSIECVAMVDENTFVSGGDSGSISLWMTQKKKPVFTQGLAHGLDKSQVDTEDVDIVRKPRWVTALGSLRYSDLFASGSWDGQICLWKLDSNLRSFALVGTIAAPGVINSLQFVTPPKDTLDRMEWASRVTTLPDENTSSDTVNGNRRVKADTVLMIAGIGQEMRFGRWIQKKGEGVINGALIVALHPRTLDS